MSDTPTPAPAAGLRRLLPGKTLTVCLLAAALLVPVSMIRELIGERQARHQQAVDSIALGWGGRQVVVAPYLAIAYERTWVETRRELVDGRSHERQVVHREQRVARIPAQSLQMSVDAQTSEKVRSIYRARLYTAKMVVRGRIELPAAWGVDAPAAQLTWRVPRLVLAISDPRGIRNVSALSIAETHAGFVTGAGDAMHAAGIHAPVPLEPPVAVRTIPFAFTLELAGTEALQFVPLARDTQVSMHANWPHPSFQGASLPATQSVNPDGFRASWQVSRYAAGGAERLAACAAASCERPGAGSFGVSFIEPVGVYQQLERTSKYGFLFIGLVFGAFYLFELLRTLAIHPIQYTLVGLALAIFFLLVTALSEHLAFAAAYALAAGACTAIITAYVQYLLRSGRVAIAFGAGLAALYGVLFVLLQAEDYALLGGALLLFILLAATMLATRRVDWYRLRTN